MKISRSFRVPLTFTGLLLCMGLLSQVGLAPSANAQEVSFQRDIQPLLAEKCWHCHGADEATRQGGLRLDDAAAAQKGGDSGAAIVPGKVDASLLIMRIGSHDADVVMPPPKEGKPLSEAEKKLFSQWIEQGAAFTNHWAFEAPRKRPLPDVGTQQPVDAWIRSRLAQQHLTPSPQAQLHTLCRRLYLDVIGLPPSPAQVEAYKRDGHAATVDALLNSPRF
ncbi:MAG: DUF1549 domain-containing protein, partial [Pirellulaceae bacterium]|nr:DUF1549 domain-containing protein [Pirellulaceae bacterium]